MNVNFRDFKNMDQQRVNNLPDTVKTQVLSQVESIYIKANVLDQDTKTLNEEEFSNAQTAIDTLIDAAKAQHANKTNKKPQFGLENNLKDGSRFTKLIEEYKTLSEEYKYIKKAADSRANELNLFSAENYFKSTSDKELVTLCNRQNQISARQDEIYKEIEDAIKDTPVGTRFQCGEYVITHKRAYTDETGDRMLVFENLD